MIRLVCSIVAIVLCVWKVFNWAWWKPRRLERYFRKQGIRGPPYRLIHGNVAENGAASLEAKAKPMNGFTHSIVPRVLPFLHQTVQKYGNLSIFWVGGNPRVDIMNPDLVRDVLLNKFGYFTKMKPNPVVKLFVTGLVSYNGGKWSKHRKIINPAFHHEKLKLMMPAFYTSCGELISRWNKLALEGSFELDIAPELQSLTEDVISRTLFGRNYQVGRQIFELQTEQQDLLFQSSQFAYIPGQETTATLLLWTIVLLSMHQEWQEHAREEVLRAFEKNQPDFDGLSHLKLMSMILYEVLRLYPPFPLLTRFTSKKAKLGEITFPQGVQVGLPILLIHHDRDLWGEDVGEFNPTRFSGGISKATKNKVSYFPFGWGPQICIGLQFALIEVKIALTMILQRFYFKLSPTYVHAPHAVLTLQPQHGAPIVFCKR
ncbi:hypothetical protein Sjap_025646 [Stephania japonica]|uniref:Cytochrome P450 n=1 Tax=Stephania japonica TaxID=461633 RepID=A0AAP0E4N7_9MAGN